MSSLRGMENSEVGMLNGPLRPLLRNVPLFVKASHLTTWEENTGGTPMPHSCLAPPSPLVTWRVDVDFGEGGSMVLRRAVEAEAREAFDDFCASDLGGHVQLFRVVNDVDEMMAEAFVCAPTAEAV